MSGTPSTASATRWQGTPLAPRTQETRPHRRLTDGERDAYRRAVLEVMTASLSLWAELTGKGRIELAERSGIWRVTLDKSSLQTRTLDKYLLMETLPSKPRWRDVVRTAEFVLSEAEEPIAPMAPSHRGAKSCRSG